MSEPDQDAIGYSQDIRDRCRKVLLQHGHGACRHDENARFDFVTSEAVCGCGHRVKMQGGQPTSRPPEVGPGTSMETIALDPVKATLATIDPTVAYTPVDLEMRILDVLARLEMGAVFERKAIEDDGAARMAFKKAYWIAKNASEATAADRREADAMVAVMDLYEEHVRAEMVRKAVAATMHNLRSILSGYQSVAKSVLADFGAGGAVR